MDIFTPITNAECVLPPAPSGGKRVKRHTRRRSVIKKRTHRRHMGGKRKTPRYVNMHSPKMNRKGRKSSKASRRN